MAEYPALTVTFLGTGTSTGVPTIACTCVTCLSDDERDKRLRPSIMIQSATTTIVVDTTPDFRQQMLRTRTTELSAILYTHHHIDHIAGFDDIRCFNFKQSAPMPLYLMQETFDHLKRSFLYAFGYATQIGGGIPQTEVHIITHESFMIGDIQVQPIPMMHGNLAVMGFRFGPVAYCTDTNYIPPDSLDRLRGVDILILDALRHEPHPTHFNVTEACTIADELCPRITYFTHIAHNLKHSETEAMLPAHIRLSYDGLIVHT
jgi:phosphoribosyl 1,2-cyclic phosphate phosphodiesterase